MDISVNGTIGKWTVLSYDKTERIGRAIIRWWLCRCECGLIKSVRESNLRQGHSNGCARCCSGRRTHGDSKSRLYDIWTGIIKRCENPNRAQYCDYGGRGIAMCQEWRKDYSRFKNWALRAGYSDSMTIERIDVNGDYSESNCTWVTKKYQSRNKRVSYPKIDYKGENIRLIDLAERLSIKYEILRNRVFRLGWSIDAAITTPIKVYKERSKS